MELVPVTIIERPDWIQWEEGHNEHKKTRHSHTLFTESDIEEIKKHSREEVVKILYQYLR